MAVVALAGAAASGFEVERVFRPEIYGRGDANARPQQPIDAASWVWFPGHDVWGGAVFSQTRTDAATLAKLPQAFFRLRRDFEAVPGEPLELDVSADERFVLLLDGREIARGPNRGLRNRWHYQSYRISDLAPGAHRLEAVVWQVGEHAPLAQVSVRGGFVLKASGAYDAALTTGVADWRIGRLANTRMTHKGNSRAFGVGSQCEVVGTSLLDEEPRDWRRASVVRGPVTYFAGLLAPGWMLFPSPLCARALQMCMHEMFFDCPYYEQQMYPGDSRVQYLVAGLFDTEDRLVRNAITLFDADRRENGLIPMNCPTRGTQDALGFTTCAAVMLGDYAWQHANADWLKARLPGLNHTLMGLATYERADGLLGRTPGWNFVDWVPEWYAQSKEGGVPPDGNGARPNGEINLQYLHAIRSAVLAEEAVGERELADCWRAKERRLAAAIRKAFWCPARSLFASDVAQSKFSEHAQCLALLADVVTGEEAARCFAALTTADDLARGTIYYKHYLYSTYFKFGRADLFFGNLGFWKNCLAWNLATVLETPETTSRSDCHGWGSHPLWHLHTGVAGVRSAAPGYAKVLVAPQPGHLKFIRSSTPTPRGAVKLDLRFGAGKVSGTVTLPDGLPGDFAWRGVKMPLTGGVNTVRRGY